MSLLRLLTAGKSLVGLKETGHRYNVAHRGLLPKFVSKKNPFRAGAHPQAGLVPVELTSAPNLSEPNEGHCANGGTGSGRAAITGSVASLSPQVMSAGSPRVKAPVAGETRKDSPSGWRSFVPWMRGRTPKLALPRFQKTMVQGELSLEAIKVVRNDLSDSDLEVVPTKPVVPAPQEKPARRMSAEPRTDERSWGRLPGGFLGAGKT